MSRVWVGVPSLQAAMSRRRTCLLNDRTKTSYFGDLVASIATELLLYSQSLFPSHPTPIAAPIAARKLLRAPATSRSTEMPHSVQ